MATQLDVLRADLLASQADATLALQREALESSGDQLKILIGRSPDVPLFIAGDLPDDAQPGVVPGPPGPPQTAEWFVTRALTSRPEALEARDRIGDAKRTAEVARWNLLPDINLNAP